jgi:ferrous iron transport protein B
LQTILLQPYLKHTYHIALTGNPNSGKSSLFNVLTGLNQQVGNFPGVTVDKKTGHCSFGETVASLMDLPGTYSLYPKRADEWVSYKVLLGLDKEELPDMVMLVADASNLRRNLLFCSQIIDLGIPVIVVLTMMDLAAKKGTKIDIDGLQRELGVPVVAINPRKNKGIADLKKVVAQVIQLGPIPARQCMALPAQALPAVNEAAAVLPFQSAYKCMQYLINYAHFKLEAPVAQQLSQVVQTQQFNATRTQAEEIMQRYSRIRQIMQHTVIEANPLQKALFTERLDKVLLHRKWGYVILLAVLFLLFQSVFWVAQYPMDGIEWLFGQLTGWLGKVLPQSWWADVLVNGVLAGLSGILVFIPQIMILFGLITLLEDTGYMARISFLTDKLMRKAGLNGKSVMPMISGLACAVPAIMSARNIENRKEKLLTIMVTPLMSCSARLPVYTILISLVIPAKTYLGFLSLQGLVMMGLYLFGTAMALLVASVLKWFIQIKEKSFFILELPVYRSPRWGNALTTMVEKAKIFVTDAGKVIMVISLILWALSSFGPAQKMKAVHDAYDAQILADTTNSEALQKEKSTALLEQSYAGHLGKAIEPAIAPLGYDWKIGIALITSFAAREVFVGTMATLYSAGDDAEENSLTLRQKMAAATRANGQPVYTLATGLSLMIFYVLAMQCMSTLAVVKRETRSWKWPVIQLLYMTTLAWLMSWLAYHIFS